MIDNRNLIVVKCGTGGVSHEAVADDIAALRRAQRSVVLVHGGADDIDELASRLGVEQRRMVAPDGVSSRYTDDATLDVMVLALAGRAKPRFVTALAARGVAAVGLTGLDAGLLAATRKRAHRAVVDGRTVIVRDDHSGRITRVNASLLHMLLAAGLVPVISPPAVAEDHRPVNVDADRVAAAIATALGAAHLVMLTASPGVLEDVEDESTRMARLTLGAEAEPASDGAPRVSGGMGLKLVAARAALLGEVPEVTIADGRVATPVLKALTGEGTRVFLSRSEEVA
ncbi:[LysW]-aminoadipate kinase [Pendulispora albinea]|uniref:Acetylglutamate kinase n=1 Tax=Pendulispora albinea TaxID=2741071 RepID=A0ABZ2LUG7_9BACT